MVHYSSTLDQTFAALADPIRRAMLMRLTQGEASVGELALPHQVSLPAMLKHVRSLERAGLVSARKEGRVRICRLVPQPLASAHGWLTHYERFWNAQLDSLDRFLTGTTPEDATWTPSRRSSPSRSAASTTSVRRGSTTRGHKRKR